MIFFFFNDTATTEIYTLSLHDALPISDRGEGEEEADEKDIQKCLGPEARRHGRTRDEWKTTVKIGVDAGRDLVELVQPDDDQGDDRRHRGDDPLVQCRRRSLARR